MPEVFGPEPAVTRFAYLWARRTHVPSTRGTQQRLFAIRQSPESLSWAEDRLRAADERDLPTLVAWTSALIAEAIPGDPTDPEQHAGYATAAVARLTQQLFAEGQAFCCLYTDLANPTSISIYQKIGYRPVCDLSNYVVNSRKTDTNR